MAAEAGTAVVDSLILLLSVFLIASAVGTFVAKVGRFPYTIALLLAGLGVSIVVAVYDVGVIEQLFARELQLSHDLILLVLLPALLFEGAATTDLERFRRNLVPILTLAVPGLLISVTLLGFVGTYAFDYTLLVSLLFASMVLPTDPVSVLALFEELGAPDRLSVLVEGESLINDGVGVVVFSTLLALLHDGASPSVLLEPGRAAEVAAELAVVSLGGLVVGLVAGYAVYSVMVNLDEQMTEIVLTIVLAYGSFVLAEHYLHVSGVIATVAAGLFIGNQGAEYAMSPRTKVSVFNTWETAAFLVNTFIFVAIGVRTPIPRLVENWQLIVAGIVLVILARAAIVYPLTALLNLRGHKTVPRSYQHVMVWGGLHASIPIALVLGLQTEAPPGVPTAELKAMVFGVAAFSLIVQGLTMGRLLSRLGIVTRTDAEELYELLVGRARAVDAALDAADRLHASGEIPSDVLEDFEAEYGREKSDLDEAIATLLQNNPELRHEQVLMGERRVLQREKGAIMDAMRSGVVSSEIGERLIEESDLKLDRIRSGESTVHKRDEGYTESWRQRAAEFGLSTDVAVEPDDRPGAED
ncbi:sodium/proton antiporter, CPA1 family (TC 2.A.36) [Halogranum amylolyticum]|uniref:Sodium/proton antiporter, CPA1 family (TC 2.A.36) n=1 Tax=Halogranum amylolyticum TaxID=660520 RepID=A0A1H8RLI7_9EURY|nr:cation:proton antiporter [Halogranum amylolyticum]SEO67419.1 sodium/proton antiporter, CPA1 family (TC 2.A.36) [Halogranum amylolyticum]